MAALPPVAYIRAAFRMSSALTPAYFATSSGLLRGSETNSAHSRYSSGSQRSLMNRSFASPSVTITWAMADSTATLVPGRSGRCTVGLDMGRAHDVGAARVDDDQLGALAQALLEARADNRMTIGRIAADDEHHIGIFDGVEILRAGGGAEGGAEAVAGRRVADARAGIDIIIAEARRGSASARGRFPRWCSATR